MEYQAECVGAFVASWRARGFSPHRRLDVLHRQDAMTRPSLNEPQVAE
ncbi:hypothetical protein [Thermomonospora echinospora]|nr:hypothetical protein [Thermomonospora echinospora]